MANRWFEQYSYSLEKKPVTIYAVADGGGAGVNMSLLQWTNSAYSAAPSGGTRGVKSIARAADGQYTFTMQDNYQRLLDVSASAMAKDGSTTPLAVACWVMANSPGASGGATVKLQFYLATPGTPVAPGTNDRWFINFTWSDSAAY